MTSSALLLSGAESVPTIGNMSVTASLPEIHPRHSLVRIVSGLILLVLLVAIVGAAAWAYWIARSPLPQLDGSIAVPGISSKVRVLRDERGVPTIEAATLEDLFFAQGYVTAQDRLWQMDMMRRAAAGELSEIIGEDTVKMDREQRILGLRQAAEAAEKNMSVRDRAYFDAYARGVNAFLESHRDRLSLEFRLLKYTPRPWRVTDCLLVGARMVQDLNHYSYERALTREKILAKLGPQLTADLYVNSSWRDRTPSDVRRIDQEPAVNSGDEDDDDDEEVDPEGGNGRLISGLGSTLLPQGLKPPSFRGLNGAAEAAPLQSRSIHAARIQSPSPYAANFWDSALEETDAFRPGSNNWVVSGQHTVSGKPLLSNDMHLAHQMPNLWFEAHLKMTT